MTITTTAPTWVSTDQFAQQLGIHPQTVRVIRRSPTNPWVEGVHYRRKGLTSSGTLQWNSALAEEAFIGMRRSPAGGVESFQRVPNPRAN